MTADVARARMHVVIAAWSDADVIRLAALCGLGTPARVVDLMPHRMTVDSRGKAHPTDGIEAEARASALHTWRCVGLLCGMPLPASHQVKP